MQKYKFQLISGVICLVTTFVIGIAEASLIRNGSTVTDDVNGKEWLRLTNPATFERSYNDIEVAINDPRDLLFGFHHASFAELGELWRQVGFLFPEGVVLTTNEAETMPLIEFQRNLFGQMDGDLTILGVYAKSNGPGTHVLARILGDEREPGTAFFDTQANYRYAPDDQPLVDTGHYLVRNTTTTSAPEPSTYVLVFTGILAIAAIKQIKGC